MLSEEQALKLIKDADVLSEGHFLLTSGNHSAKYLQCANIFKNTNYSEILCKSLAEYFEKDNVQIVIGPAMGAVLMSYEMSKHLNCENYFTERENGKMVLKRGFCISPNTRVLLVEDVITTGCSIKEVYALVKEMGADVVGIASIIDRTNGNVDFEVPLKSVLSFNIEVFKPNDCPICKSGNADIVKPGSRKIEK